MFKSVRKGFVLPIFDKYGLKFLNKLNSLKYAISVKQTNPTIRQIFECLYSIVDRGVRATEPKSRRKWIVSLRAPNGAFWIEFWMTLFFYCSLKLAELQWWKLQEGTIFTCGRADTSVEASCLLSFFLIRNEWTEALAVQTKVVAYIVWASNFKYEFRSDLRAIWGPYWPQKSSESLKNSPNILTNQQKSKSSNSLMSATGLLGLSLVLQEIKVNVTRSDTALVWCLQPQLFRGGRAPAVGFRATCSVTWGNLWLLSRLLGYWFYISLSMSCNPY